MASWTGLGLYYYLLRRAVPQNAQSDVLQLIWPLSRLVFILIACHQLVQVAVVSSFVTVPHLPAAAMYLAIVSGFSSFFNININILGCLSVFPDSYNCGGCR